MLGRYAVPRGSASRTGAPRCSTRPTIGLCRSRSCRRSWRAGALSHAASPC